MVPDPRVTTTSSTPFEPRVADAQPSRPFVENARNPPTSSPLGSQLLRNAPLALLLISALRLDRSVSSPPSQHIRPLSAPQGSNSRNGRSSNSNAISSQGQQGPLHREEPHRARARLSRWHAINPKRSKLAAPSWPIWSFLLSQPHHQHPAAMLSISAVDKSSSRQPQNLHQP